MYNLTCPSRRPNRARLRFWRQESLDFRPVDLAFDHPNRVRRPVSGERAESEITQVSTGVIVWLLTEVSRKASWKSCVLVEFNAACERSDDDRSPPTRAKLEGSSIFARGHGVRKAIRS